MLYYREVEILADILFVNDVPFLTSILYHINYGTLSVVDNLKYLILKSELQNFIRFYVVRRFKVSLIVLDT